MREVLLTYYAPIGNALYLQILHLVLLLDGELHIVFVTAALGFLKNLTKCIKVFGLDRDGWFKSNVGGSIAFEKKVSSSSLKQLVDFDACCGFLHERRSLASCWGQPLDISVHVPKVARQLVKLLRRLFLPSGGCS